MRQALLTLIFILSAVAAQADFTPTAYYLEDGVEAETTDAIAEGQAPLAVVFKANADEATPEGTSLEWRFTREGEQEPYLRRYGSETEYEFRESGSTRVALWATYPGEAEAVEIGSIRVSISTSMLEMPNAFSPNGDGINDIYKAKEGYRSLINFHATIFNRWGVKLYEWTDPAGGWDGTHSGHDVADGVYFCLVKAVGADGRKYNIKRDVNLLRNYEEGVGQ